MEGKLRIQNNEIKFDFEKYLFLFYSSTGQLLTKIIRNKLETRSFGNKYTYRDKHGTKHTHIASMPGKAPNNKSLKLTKSLRYSIKKSDSSLNMEVGYKSKKAQVGYARFLEGGTRYMAARPFFTTNINSKIKVINKMFDLYFIKKGMGF